MGSKRYNVGGSTIEGRCTEESDKRLVSGETGTNAGV
jgi:hypothetical protein